MTMSNKLKPCPFCGGEAEYGANSVQGYEYVRCASCKARTWSCYETKEQAAQAWNTRAERTCHLERIPYEPGEYEGMRCSVCKTVDLEMGVGPYCPGCGAKVVEL